MSYLLTAVAILLWRSNMLLRVLVSFLCFLLFGFYFIIMKKVVHRGVDEGEQFSIGINYQYVLRSSPYIHVPYRIGKVSAIASIKELVQGP